MGVMMNILKVKSNSLLLERFSHILRQMVPLQRLGRFLSAGYFAAMLLAVGELTTSKCYAFSGSVTLSLDTNDAPCPKCPCPH